MQRCDVPTHTVNVLHNGGSGCSFSVHPLPHSELRGRGAEFLPRMCGRKWRTRRTKKRYMQRFLVSTVRRNRHTTVATAAGGEIFNQCVADQDEAFTEKDVVRLIRQILQGVLYLHRNNVVHLDLKPQNILLTSSKPLGDIRIVDFGLSRQVDNIKEVREILGTPEYVAPEVLSYEPISTATDMWSIGVLAYVMLTGTSPFLGDTKQETFLNISQVAVQYPQEEFEGISDDAINFIKSLLIKNPRKRARADQCLKHSWLSSHQEPEPLKAISFEQNESELETPEASEEIVLLASYTVHCPCLEILDTDLQGVRNQFTALKEIQPEVVC
ncbi:unnamed protein product [Ranitomeya imitator]|uniref:Protein kinase domain-containing protein n=1 Tax=Ranitomeya imitator TaxID=111125 RepID=A0ABN9KTW0_9NEOB|nr:unnamed protein product [Ranitomeya imitator]